jgi:hypothetical protein
MYIFFHVAQGEFPIFKSIFCSNQLVGDMVSMGTTVTFGVGFNKVDLLKMKMGFCSFVCKFQIVQLQPRLELAKLIHQWCQCQWV